MICNKSRTNNKLNKNKKPCKGKVKSFFFLFLPLQGLIMGFLKWLAQLKRLP